MATIVPDQDEIDSFSTPLTTGELQILGTLAKAFEDDASCIIYVQPHLNGLNPDFVLFSEDAGVCVIEVKDWSLANYQVQVEDRIYDDADLTEADTNRKHLSWQVYDRSFGRYVIMTGSQCPFDQAQKYKDSIINYEIPSIRARISLGEDKFYGLIQTIVAFARSPRSELDTKLSVIRDHKLNRFKYRYIGTEECSNPKTMREFLEKNGFRKGSQFTAWMKTSGFAGRLRNALGYPEHGNYELKHLLISFSDKQKDLLDNTLGTARRVLGVAGSGKTLVVVQKAVDSARAGHTILLVCFNITMATHLHELCTRLARHFDRNLNRKIEVGHYHRFFKMNGDLRNEQEAGGFYIKGGYNVLLIDEGQDFQRDWIQRLQNACKPPYHFFFAEDERQDIYRAAQLRGRQVPGIRGRPNTLSSSYRLPHQIVLLVNRFAEAMQLEQEQLPIDDGQLTLPGFVDKSGNERRLGHIVYASGTKRQMLDALRSDLHYAWNSGSFDAVADNAILVASVADGWDVNEITEQLEIPTRRTFESREEYARLSGSDEASISDIDDMHFFSPYIDYKVNDAVWAIRRAYKVAFRMRTGSLKLATIHSFKGWELKRIYVFFDPKAGQGESRHHLLYTAMTRCQYELRIYDCTNDYQDFFSQAIYEKLVEPRRNTTTEIPF